MEHLLDDLELLSHMSDDLSYINHGITLSSTLGIDCHSIPQVLPDTDIVDNQSSWLILVDSIHTSDGLHEIRSFHLLVDIHRMETGSIESCEPHISDNDHLE